MASDAARSLTVEVPESGSVSALLSGEPGTKRPLVVYAPGAGSSLRDSFGAFLAGLLGEAGYGMLRFQFPYTEAGRSVPDRNPVLEATWLEVILEARKLAPSLVVGGRSMGGRIASQVVAQGIEVAGLALFAYPLHPPGRPDKPRDAHLGSIAVPSLLCSGTRDTFASPEELLQAAARLDSATLHFLEGADHSFNVAKATGRTRSEVWQEAGEALLAYLKQVELDSGP
jgi:predicted alpha/beta-hydrolase family hydrolase